MVFPPTNSQQYNHCLVILFPHGSAWPSMAQHGPAWPSSQDERPPAQPSSLVLAPTRELVQQIAIEAKKLAPAINARVLGIFGGVGKGAADSLGIRWKQLLLMLRSSLLVVGDGFFVGRNVVESAAVLLM